MNLSSGESEEVKTITNKVIGALRRKDFDRIRILPDREYDLIAAEAFYIAFYEIEAIDILEWLIMGDLVHLDFLVWRAIYDKKYEFVEFCLKRGANVDYDSYDAFYWGAVDSGDRRMVEILLPYVVESVKNNYPNDSEVLTAALTMAAEAGNFEIGKLLLKYGASPYYPTQESPLMVATVNDDLNFIRLLLDANPPDIKNALKYATSEEAILLLRSKLPIVKK